MVTPQDMRSVVTDASQNTRAVVDVPAGKSGRRITSNSESAAAVSAEIARTTAKVGRSDRPVAKTTANSVVQPADAATEVAMSNEPVAKVVQVSNPVLRNDAMRKAPTVVYTAGFQKDLPAGNANRFTGNAVTFMSIAKFSKTN